MGIKISFTCDHVDGRADLYNAGRCGWMDDSFGYATPGDVSLPEAITKLGEKGWGIDPGGKLLCPNHNPARTEGPTEITVNVPPATVLPKTPA